ncbi:MAG: methyltransferase [Bermanella sp.]
MLDCATGQYALLRPGANPRQSLRAWDAADEYLISLIHESFSHQPLTLFNDQFGALAIALEPQVKTWINDSFCAKSALQINQQQNEQTSLITQASPLDNWPQQPSLGVMKLPKNLSYLHHLLEGCAKSNISKVLIAGMMKHLPKNILGYLQKFGGVKRHPFKKKATIYELDIKQITPSLYPKSNQLAGMDLVSHANVFGRDKLDPGAQFFIENIKSLPLAHHVADLCCGSGILGLKYMQHHLVAENSIKMEFFDESFMAVKSAELSWAKNNLNGEASFHWNDGLDQENNQKYDLILCNPPFHEEHTVGDHISKRLFKDAKQQLKSSGKLIVVGNRHLGYHVSLKTYFKNVKQIAANGKFILLSAHA